MTSFIIDLHNKCAYIYYKTEVAHYDRNSGSHISGMVAQAYRTGGSFEHRLFKQSLKYAKELCFTLFNAESLLLISYADLKSNASK